LDALISDVNGACFETKCGCLANVASVSKIAQQASTFGLMRSHIYV